MIDGLLEGMGFLYGAGVEAGIGRFLLGCHHEQVMMDTAVEDAEQA